MKRIRTLRADEIEVRAADRTQAGLVHYLLYIDSRAAVSLLDETYGMENWTIEYRDVAGEIYGRLSIYDEESGRWVFREDTGEESNISAAKGRSSDILKRCVARFGVSELYTSPAVYLESGLKGLKVGEIRYDEGRRITGLKLIDRYGNEVYDWTAGSTARVGGSGSSSRGGQDNRPSMTLEDFRARMTEAKNSGRYRMDRLKAFYDFYTGPDRDNPSKRRFESFRNFSFDERLSKWKDVLAE